MRAIFYLALLPFAVALLCCGPLHAAGRRTSSGNGPARDASDEATTAALFEFAKPVPEAFWETLKDELDKNAAPEWPDRSVIWMKGEEFQQNVEYPEIVQVRLLGHCGVEPTVAGRTAKGPLGWAYVVEGKIQPVAYVNCDRIGETLERELRGASGNERRKKFSRAISRVVAHELNHIFLQSCKHSASGLQKSSLTARDLTREDAP